MNEILFFGCLIAAFTAVVMAHRIFGVEGLIAWVALATVLANIFVTKQVRLFGLDATLGNILFASTYLCMDILTEVAGIKTARKAVHIGLCSALVFVVASQAALWFVPNELDTVSTAMGSLLTFSARTALASISCFYLANLADIHLFEKLKQKYPDALWLRNNVSTIVCNCAENFLFITAAFLGICSLKECLMIAAATSAIEIIVALCDTPFLYWARRNP